MRSSIECRILQKNRCSLKSTYGVLVLCFCIFLLYHTTNVYGAYKAYELRILCNGKTSVVVASMAPKEYIAYHGGIVAIQSVEQLLYWLCPGDTSNFKKICPKPEMVNPKLRKGEKVKVNLKDDPFDGTEGTVVTGMYSSILAENVYGVDLTDGVYVIFGEDAIQPANQKELKK